METKTLKVLYAGHYREDSGWSKGIIDYILALDSAGVDVVCRPIKLNTNVGEVPDRIVELENKSIDGSTVCIQHVLPHFMEYNSKVKNIGIFYMEGSTNMYTAWQEKLEQMDEIWVPNERMLGKVGNSKLVPQPSNLEKFKHKESLNLPDVYDGYKFYSIIDLNYRKNLPDLLRAFHTAFRPHEPVSLVLKINGQKEKINNICEAVRAGLKLHLDMDEYKREIIINNRLSDKQILSLHNTCDCYVSTSYSEGWCIPLFDAAGFGNSVISNECDGAVDFLPEECIVKCQKDRCFNMTETFSDMHTGYEEWNRVSVPDLIDKMRAVYEDSKKPEYNLERFSYQSVGNIMKDRLCEL